MNHKADLTGRWELGRKVIKDYEAAPYHFEHKLGQTQAFDRAVQVVDYYLLKFTGNIK